MVVLIIVVIVIMMIIVVILIVVVIIIVPAPDEASVEQHGEGSQQDRQFQSRPFSIVVHARTYGGPRRDDMGC